MMDRETNWDQYNTETQDTVVNSYHRWKPAKRAGMPGHSTANRVQSRTMLSKTDLGAASGTDFPYSVAATDAPRLLSRRS